MNLITKRVLGNLISVNNLAMGDSVRYGYGESGLNLVTGEEGIVITDNDQTFKISPLTGDFGSVIEWTGQSVTGTVTEGETDFYSFSLRTSELQSTETGFVLLGVEVTGLESFPQFSGLTPVSLQTTGNGTLDS